ncbi:EAL domain-containing protein, partial [Eggerthella lenta]|uniref:EAL domain-containing protein n=1 Tax=Eggerthella lenta TaxID=84112 RepID=UPI003F7395EC
MERYDVPPSLLNLEITESAYMESPDQLVGAVMELRRAGFTVEMDDFGSGYSSLNTLKDVPVDVLKLDMGFLDAHDGGEDEAAARALVRIE